MTNIKSKFIKSFILIFLTAQTIQNNCPVAHANNNLAPPSFIDTENFPYKILIECGSDDFDPANRAKAALDFIRKAKEDNINLQLLPYDREYNLGLPHTNYVPASMYKTINDVIGEYRKFNESGIPFCLALNGFPNSHEHTELSAEEKIFLEELRDSGKENKVINSVTVADNALAEDIKKRYPELQIIASCISAAFLPNLTSFRENHYTGRDFWVEYHRYLYTIYDKVVLMNQLTNPTFVEALDDGCHDYMGRTMFFLALSCGAENLGYCSRHYSNKRFDSASEGFPLIPDKYLSRKIGLHKQEPENNCPYNFISLHLARRPFDLIYLLKKGARNFKIPARNKSLREMYHTLSTIMQIKHRTELPEKNEIWGYSQDSIQASFMSKYPESVWHILYSYEWPEIDYTYTSRPSYPGYKANDICNKLHALAVEAYEAVLKTKTSKHNPHYPHRNSVSKSN